MRRSVKTSLGIGWALLLVAATADAHIPLTQRIIDDALGDIAEARTAAESETGERAPALYELATRATALMDLLNQEIALHGLEQQELLDDAVASAASLGVDIRWSAAHERYFYTGAAYARYLELVGDGLEAANSRFHLIETGFYLGDAGDRDELAARIEMADDYLDLYPDTANAARVAIFLAIDYRDLWRLCRARDDAACIERAASQLREHLDAASTSYGDDRTGQMVRALLARFDAEAAAPTDPR